MLYQFKVIVILQDNIVGLYLKDALNFKQALHTKAIKLNYRIRIKANDIWCFEKDIIKA